MKENVLTIKEVKSTEHGVDLGEAYDCEVSGWRLPTVFEMLHIQAHMDDSYSDGPFWTGSPTVGAHRPLGGRGPVTDTREAWAVSVLGKPFIKQHDDDAAVIIVRASSVNFDYVKEVSKSEVHKYLTSEVLPRWHPSFRLDTESVTRVLSSNQNRRRTVTRRRYD